jgi:hypothetical protein
MLRSSVLGFSILPSCIATLGVIVTVIGSSVLGSSVLPSELVYLRSSLRRERRSEGIGEGEVWDTSRSVSDEGFFVEMSSSSDSTKVEDPDETDSEIAFFVIAGSISISLLPRDDFAFAEYRVFDELVRSLLAVDGCLSRWDFEGDDLWLLAVDGFLPRRDFEREDLSLLEVDGFRPRWDFDGDDFLSPLGAVSGLRFGGISALIEWDLCFFWAFSGVRCVLRPLVVVVLVVVVLWVMWCFEELFGKLDAFELPSELTLLTEERYLLFLELVDCAYRSFLELGRAL